MTTSNEHKRIKKWLADLMAIFFEHAGTQTMPGGQTTMRKPLK